MAFTASDVIPLSQARATFSELADQVKAGAEKIITKNGESYVAIIDAQRLDYYHQLEREHIHLRLIDDDSLGLQDVAAGRVSPARTRLAALKRSRLWLGWVRHWIVGCPSCSFRLSTMPRLVLRLLL